MSGKNLTVMSVTENTVEIQFEQIEQLKQLDDGISSYYFYIAEYKDSNITFKPLNDSQLWHNSSVNLVSMSITSLKSGTDYKIRVVPYREISHSNFSNQQREAGVPSMEVTFTTGRRAFFLNLDILISPMPSSSLY